MSEKIKNNGRAKVVLIYGSIFFWSVCANLIILSGLRYIFSLPNRDILILIAGVMVEFFAFINLLASLFFFVTAVSAYLSPPKE